jgi:protein gp37
MYRESLNNTRYNPLNVVKTKTVFKLPLKLKEPSKIFTSSLTDFFHEECDSFRGDAWDIIRRCPQHTFQILTKRTERLDYDKGLFPNSHFGNVWLGTSVGSRKSAYRIFDLVNARVSVKLKFLSIEPYHDGPIRIEGFLNRLGWVIVGGESGNENGLYRYRECKIEWIKSIVDQCKKARVPVFVKQLGTHLSKKMGLKDRHGGDINEWPEHLRVRQFPKT